MRILVLAIMVCTTLTSITSLDAQCLSGNCQNGKGLFQLDNGAKYSGEFQNGTIHGQGILTFSNGDKYLGTFANQFREGNGKFIFANGDEYIGQFKQNKFDGEGKIKYKNGNLYEGNWIDGQPNGLGEIRYANGARYEGMVKAGLPEGEGTIFYANQTQWTGKWKNGKEINKTTPTATASTDNNAKKQAIRNCNTIQCHNCEGEYRYADGSRFVGTFKNGLPEGKGTMEYINSDRYVGGWSNHAPHGEGIMYYSSGRSFGGLWNYGTPTKELSAMSNVGKEHVETVVSSDVRVWALVVGVGRYAHMPTLKYTDDDAYHYYSFLKSPEGGALRDEQIKVLIDEDATRDAILRTMRQLFLKADENDVVMLYFSGHGLDGCFVPVDFDGYNNRLAHEDIKAIFAESKAKHKICVADACFSGSLLAVKSANVDIVLSKYYKQLEDTKGGLALFMSSKSQEYSLEDHGLRSGIFSHYMIKGLKGEADSDKNKVITIKELFDFTSKNVKTYTSGAQTPTISGDYDPKMPIGVVR